LSLKTRIRNERCGKGTPAKVAPTFQSGIFVVSRVLPSETFPKLLPTIMSKNRLRQQLHAGSAAFGMWVTLDCPNVTEAAVAAGIDWIVIEMEHGHLHWRDVIDHLRVTSGAGTAAIVRIADCTRENIQRALDIGADGLIVPMISDGPQLEQAFQWGRYPPRGIRGVGGERCVRWGLQTASYLESANDETLIIPLLETRGAVENMDEILRVDGLEVIFFGPADMSAGYGHLGQWEGGNVAQCILEMQRKAADRGIHSGILGRDAAEVAARLDQGFRMISLGADVNMMLRSLNESLASARRVITTETGDHPSSNAP
jgi:2-dehydro-3-deoxyglucarate aldolase/4-hydroxy-2-oxoheptanedioate aldolase